MHRFFAVAAALAAFSVAPAFGQEPESYTEEQVAEATAAIEAAELSDGAYRDFWCGSALLIVMQLLQNNGDAEGAAQVQGLADVLFTRVAGEMIAAEVSEEDFNALTQNFRVVAISQTGPDAEPDYTQEDCMAATAE